MDRLSRSGLAVPEVVESGVHDGRPYFVTPWFGLGSLESVAADGRFRADPVAGLRHLVELAGILSKVHAHDVAHRDLKPANILLDDVRGMALSDFGLALPVGEALRLTESREAVGSRFYIAPENESGFDERADQRPADFFAYAKVIYAVLTGRPPRHRMDDLEEGWRIADLTGDPVLDRLSGLQRALLVPTPASRMTDWDAVEAELNQLVADLSGSAPEGRDQEANDDDLIRSARNYRASVPALRFEAEREQAAERQRMVADIGAAIHRGLRSADARIERIRTELGDSMSIDLSRGSMPLSEVLGLPGVRSALGSIVGEWVKEVDGIEPWVLRDRAQAIIWIAQQLPGIERQLHLLAYLMVRGDDAWLVGVPVLHSFRPEAPPAALPQLFDLVHGVTGPYPIGLDSTRRAAERFGARLVDSGLTLLKEILATGSQTIDEFVEMGGARGG